MLFKIENVNPRRLPELLQFKLHFDTEEDNSELTTRTSPLFLFYRGNELEVIVFLHKTTTKVAL